VYLYIGILARYIDRAEYTNSRIHQYTNNKQLLYNSYMAASVSLSSFVAFGDLLRYLRRRARLTQLELSIAVGYSEGQISRLETNQRPPDLAAVLALFVPALDLEDEPDTVARLLELAAQARGETMPQSVTLVRTIQQEVIEEQDAPPPGNLPLSLTSFIGRERETAALQRLLLSTRLVTLTGMGGSGKTRLALHAAAALAHAFPYGAWFVELAPLDDPALVPQAVASALGVQTESSQPLPTVLTSYLQTKQLLLLLDNCEHVVGATAELAESLLQSCPTLRLLTTSRETLGVPGEMAFRVPPLTLPNPTALPPIDELSQYEAIQLFVERAQAVLPDFRLTPENATAVFHVCHRLDGIPLAIELAAARVGLLRVEQIAARLDDVFHLLSNGRRTTPRHRALRATIDWSYNLLAEPERALLRHLAVFAGNFTLEAAEAIYKDEGRGMKDETVHPSSFILHPLSGLVNKSLVVAERPPGQEARYHLLETVRQYALEKLVEAGEATAARCAHLAYYLTLAETAKPQLSGPKQLVWLDRLEQGIDNFRAALAHALAQDDPDLSAGLRLLMALWHFLQVRGYHESSVWLERFMLLSEQWPRSSAAAKALSLAAISTNDAEETARLYAASMALCHELADRATLAFSLELQGHSAWWQDYEVARSRFAESLAIARELGNRSQAADILCALGELGQVHQVHRATVRAFMEEGLQLYREAGNRLGVAIALAHLGDVVMEQGDLVAGEAYCREGLALSRELGYRYGINWGLQGLGIAAWGRGDFPTAVAHLEECLAVGRKSNGIDTTGLALYWLGIVTRFQGDLERAAALFEELFVLSQKHNLTWGFGHAYYGLGEVRRLAGDLAVAEGQQRQAFMALQAINFQWSLTYVLDALAYLAIAHQRPLRAARLFGAAAALRHTNGVSLYPIERARYEQAVAAVRSALNQDSFAAAWAEGQSMTMEAIAEYALAAD
jgi:predicted ATPase/transcriptional regulator with XRE-family HTH domain/tetratricopeptide (TPR) repeat protein